MQVTGLTYQAAMVACQRGLQWQLALDVLDQMRSANYAPVSEPGKIEFFTKTVFFTIQVEIGEV